MIPLPARLTCLKTIFIVFVVWLMSARSQAELVSFQFGVAGYASVVDTTLINNQGDNSERNPLSVQSGDGQFSTKNSLILFDQIFGTGNNNIPIGSTIASATLELRTWNAAASSGGQVNFHRMLMPWDPTDNDDAYGQSPWNSAAWIQADDVEAASTFNASFVPSAADTTFQVDVTSDLQAWANGDPYYGWVLLGDASQDDQAEIYSSEASTVSFRPKLTVGFNCVPEPGLLGDISGDGQVDIGDFTLWGDAFGETGDCLPADLSMDGSVDIGDFTIWGDNFGNTAAPAGGGTNPNAVPEPSALVLLAIGLAALSAFGWRRRAKPSVVA